MFDPQTNDQAATLVNRWKKIVKDHKLQEQQLIDQAKSKSGTLNGGSGESTVAN